MKAKHILTTAALAAMLVVPVSGHADLLFGVHGEVQYWQAENSGSFSQNPNPFSWGWDDEGATRVSLSLNHFVPFVPNVMIQKQWLESSGSTPHDFDLGIGNTVFQANANGSLQYNWDLAHDTYTLYYRFFDNSLVGFHFGVAAKRFTGEMEVTDGNTAFRSPIDETVPMAYLRLNAGLPFTGLSVRAQGYPVSVGDHEVYDVEASLRYEFLDSLVLDGAIQIGYRVFNVAFEDASGLYTDFEMKGPFASISLHF
ncbi:TIGR04219 family outer membrane beta-barrel protein [Aliidiomarina celeris]|uniref:TIGR04219 family outer membrane beta-barrel protein n=1 Tax=Aliidiomarina celeris TaxID=2249428 RepID=UPI0013009A63|nr:TIGR04219 family outer membrane beta-barrel protein [Aliidiomarina celeris]